MSPGLILSNVIASLSFPFFKQLRFSQKAMLVSLFLFDISNTLYSRLVSFRLNIHYRLLRLLAIALLLPLLRLSSPLLYRLYYLPLSPSAGFIFISISFMIDFGDTFIQR